MTFIVGLTDEQVREVFAHPRVFPDFESHRGHGAFQRVARRCLCIGVTWDAGLEGVFVVDRIDPNTAEVHCGFKPSAWGTKAREAGRRFIQFFFNGLGLSRMIAPVAQKNRLAIRYVIRLGLRWVRTDAEAIDKPGGRQDAEVYELTRKEWACLAHS